MIDVVEAFLLRGLRARAKADRGANVRVDQIAFFAVVAGTLLPVVLHHHVHGGFDLGHFALAF